MPRRPVIRHPRFVIGKAGGQAPRQPAPRRALGAALARCRPLRRHARLRQGQAAPERMAVPRLRHSRLQRRQTVCAFRAGADCWRRAFSRHARRHRSARLHRRRAVGLHRPHRGAGDKDRRQNRAPPRSRRHDRKHDRHLLQHHGPLRAVPQSQIRSHPAGGLLRAASRLRRARPRRPEILPRRHAERALSGTDAATARRRRSARRSRRAAAEKSWRTIHGAHTPHRGRIESRRAEAREHEPGLRLPQRDFTKAGCDEVGAGGSRRDRDD